MRRPARKLIYGSETISYDVQFLASRTTLSIEVCPDGRVTVRAPVGCSEELIGERVRKRAAWISRQLVEFEGYHPRTPPRHYVNGETHLYLGRQYRLKVSKGDMEDVKLTRGELQIRLTSEPDVNRIKTVLRRWYLDRARVIFREVLAANLGKFQGVDPPRLNIRTMKSRWGSLSRAGTMTLNVELVRAPHVCIEYVIAHELCHIRYRHHDLRFFRLLSEVMPDWEKRKARLEAALL